MSDTPRTDDAYFRKSATMYDMAGEMKRMERELNAANAKIKRLEEAGNKAILNSYLPDRLAMWNKAKEDKP